MRPKANVLIAEPSDIIREGLMAIMGNEEFSYLAPLRDIPVDLPLRMNALQPDILVLNPNLLPPPQRLLLSQIMQSRPQTNVVALVYQYVDTQLLQGFKTVLDIRSQASQVLQLMRECCHSEVEAQDDNYDLSERESEVLLLVAKGLSSREIADKLCISIHTVNTHRKNITHKTGIKSVAGLAVYAMLHSLV